MIGVAFGDQLVMKMVLLVMRGWIVQLEEELSLS